MGFGICAPFDGKGSESATGAIANAINAESGSVIVKWQVVLTETTAYLYINDVLTLYGNPGAFELFNISSANANLTIWGVELAAKTDDAIAYHKITVANGLE